LVNSQLHVFLCAKDGKTALSLAKENGHKELAALLKRPPELSQEGITMPSASAPGKK